jgi:alcohol dehydrogenase (cytochrome c)
MTPRLGGVVVAACLAGGLAAGATLQVENFKPITDAVLLDPDPSDWINWRRTLDGWGYSPLDQITRENVATLQLVWSWAKPAGTDEGTPLVYDGIMYLPGRRSIQALDAATGDFIWEYTPPATDGSTSSDRPPSLARRNIAIYDDKIFAATSDAHLIAIDATTGTPVWDHRVADRTLGYSYSSGPIIVKGRVVAGITGCTRYKDDVCFISAHDAQTGRELWRTSTIARPGEAGGDTWGDLPLAFRAGSDAWLPGSYDPQTDLIYWSTAQAKPWASAQRGTDGAALYTNSTLAIDPETGDISWYFQHIPAETHDLDEAFETVLVDDGTRQSLFKMGKIGVLWELDRRTGAFLNAFDLGYQTVVDIDPISGQGMLRPEVVPRLGVPVDYCPGRGGLKNLWAMAYHPETRAFYIPLTPGCAEDAVYHAMPERREVGGGGMGESERPFVAHPASPNHLGDFVAMDSRTGEILWRRRSRLPYGTSALTTAGGLVFVGDFDRYFYAFDVETGTPLWQTRAPTALDGFPITYAVDGRQYIAVASGAGWFVAWPNVLDVFPDVHQPIGDPVIQVFALPE